MKVFEFDTGANMHMSSLQGYVKTTYDKPISKVNVKLPSPNIKPIKNANASTMTRICISSLS
jgi:hypothetical protein